jgi:hypothetical protein
MLKLLCSWEAAILDFQSTQLENLTTNIPVNLSFQRVQWLPKNTFNQHFLIGSYSNLLLQC